MKLYKKKVKQHCTEDVMEEVNEDEPETCEASATVEESASVDEDCASEVESQTACITGSFSTKTIELLDIGFAKEQGFDWYPAMKLKEIARGSRISVIFFSTGQTCIVNDTNWVSYSEHTVKRFTSSESVKTSSFSAGFDQMMVVVSKISNGLPVDESDIGFSSTLEPRRRRKLNKDHLQIEDEENERLLESKMYFVETDQKWKCRNCPWEGPYRHKAKAHSRDCGQRRRVSKKKPRIKKFSCSSDGCGLSFYLRSELSKHYRYVLHACDESFIQFNPIN